MKVFFAIPTADPIRCGITFAKWRDMGYITAALTDGGCPRPENCDFWLPVERYPGYANSVNYLSKLCLKHKADIIVTGGDDIFPDTSKRADEIGLEFVEHFGGSLGIMEPTGDRFGIDSNGTCAAERVCICPWMGREYVRRGYRGNGPLYHAYYHFFVDEELKCVAEKLDILWQRPDLTQYHDHWTRNQNDNRPYLDKARDLNAESKALFWARFHANFPGHELLKD